MCVHPTHSAFDALKCSNEQLGWGSERGTVESKIMEGGLIPL